MIKNFRPLEQLFLKNPEVYMFFDSHCSIALWDWAAMTECWKQKTNLLSVVWSKDI